MHTGKSNRLAIFIFVFPAFVLFSIVVVFTIFASIHYSMQDWNGIKPAVFVGLGNYKTILFSNATTFLPSVKNSLLLAGLSLFIQLPVAIFIAITISNVTKGERFFRTAYFIPVIIMTAITAQLWLKIYDPQYGLLNEVLRLIGLGSLQRNWTIDSKTAFLAAIFPGFWQWMGYHMLILYTGVKNVPTDIIEAAKIDGASKLRQAFNITIPLIMPAIKVCATLMLVGSMKSFDLVYMITKGGPMNISEVPTLTMFITMFERYQYGLGSAMAIVVIAFCFLYAVLMNVLFKKSELIN